MASNKIVSYKKINIDNIVIEKPVKTKNNSYISRLSYNNDTFNMQTPSLTFNSQTNISFKMINKGVFFNFLEEFDEKIIELIYKNSCLFFHGKKFSENKIREAYQKSFEIDNQGLVNLKNCCFVQNIKVYDSFKDITSMPEFPFEGQSILNFHSLMFIKNKITPCFYISNIKIPITKKKISECIFEDEEVEEIPKPKEIQEPEQDLLDSQQEIFEEQENNLETMFFFDEEDI